MHMSSFGLNKGQVSLFLLRKLVKFEKTRSKSIDSQSFYFHFHFKSFWNEAGIYFKHHH